MASHAKVEQGLRKMAHEAGLTVLSVSCSNHVKVQVQAPDGRTGMFVAALTPSDRRATLNQQARFKRFARGLDTCHNRGQK